jgi:ElaB/YqjD/DUF883 family membrane-anchored ribosome-binding protein
MENNVGQNKDKVANTLQQPPINQALDSVKQFSSRVASQAKEQIGNVTEMTEDTVRKYPIAAVGIALGSGVLLGGILGALLKPNPPTLWDKVVDLKIGEYFAGLVKKFS